MVTEYWKHGRRHRIGGPAIINEISGEESWFIENQRVDEIEGMLGSKLTNKIKSCNKDELAIYLISDNPIVRNLAKETYNKNYERK